MPADSRVCYSRRGPDEAVSEADGGLRGKLRFR